MEIRQPPAVRVFFAVFAAAWCAFAGAAIAAAALEGSPVIVVPLVLLPGGSHLLYRLYSMQVRGEGDRLLIRNTYSSRVLERSAVKGFRLGAASIQPFGLTVHVLADGIVVPLDAAAQAWPSSPARRQLQGQLEELEQWQLSG